MDNCYIVQSILQLSKGLCKVKNDNKYEEIRDIALNPIFWDEAEAVVNLLAPIDNSLAICEKNSTELSMVYLQFSILLNSEYYMNDILSKSHPKYYHYKYIQQNIIDLIKTRRSKYISPVIRAAAFLDHRTNPEILKNENNECELDISIQDTIEIAVSSLRDNERGNHAIALQKELEQWHNERVEKKLYTNSFMVNRSPTHYWKFITKYPNIKSIACKIFACSSSSASSERSWSIHDFIHTKRRNRLSTEKVRKLVFVYANMKMFLLEDVRKI